MDSSPPSLASAQASRAPVAGRGASLALVPGRGSDTCWMATPRAGGAAAALVFWALALVLFVVPFLRTPDGPQWIGEDTRRAEFDIPFEEDIQIVEEDVGLGQDLSAALTEASEAWFGLDSEPFLEEELVELARIAPGREVYDLNCGGCHGDNGNGAGPAARFLHPRPRNYRKAIYKFTSTASGQRPLREDLFRTVTRGLAGSSMPGFPLIPEESRHDVVEYVRYLSMRGEFERLMLDFTYEDEELPDPGELAELVYERWDPQEQRTIYPDAIEPEFTAESIARGKELFLDTEVTNCASCHGAGGKGDGIQADSYDDDWGYPIVPRDLTSGVYRAGGAPDDLWRSIATGIGGTPMGAFRGNLTGKEIWNLVHYIQSLAGREVR